MAKRNALMEWLDQIKKLAKSKDYVCLAVIDQIFDFLFYIEPKVLKKHKDFFADICARYHKDNPLDFIHDRKTTESFYEKNNGTTIDKTLRKRLIKQHQGRMPQACAGGVDWKSCALSKFGMDTLSEFVDGSLTRSEIALKDIEWQWFEVVDFMWERPELINPDAIDDYITERINTICKKRRKNNPLMNGVKDKFGKFWKGEDGKWYKERRVRI